MSDETKSKEELLRELAELRRREAELEAQQVSMEQVVKERDLLRAVINDLPNHIYVKDKEGRFVLTNDAHAQFLGVATVADMIGKTDFDFHPHELATQYYEGEWELYRSGESLVGIEIPYVDSTGKPGWALTSKMIWQDEQGQVLGLIGINQDITYLKQTQEELKEYREKLEELVAERTAELTQANFQLQQHIGERQQAEGERSRLQQELVQAQQQLIAELSTPIIPLLEGIVVLPLIGSIDTMRARDITRSLLAGIRQHQAKIVIVDITGVPMVDSGVANHLHKTIQAAQLKGAQTIVTGISEAVAETVVDLGIDWSHIETLANLQTGMVAALNRLGLTLQRRKSS
jgi:rsbT co-antagonist protein RsbR